MIRSVFLLLAAAFTLPASAQIPTKIYGQQLVDEVVAKYPDVLLIGLHVTPPKSQDNVIIASNFGRIGKRGDEDDMAVIRTGKSKMEVNPSGTRFAVELVLQDVSGETIGALGLNFPYRAGDDKAALNQKAEKIRDELKRRIANAGNLMEPYPFDALATTRMHAQKLVNQTMEKYPDLLIMAMHVSPPGVTSYPIIASTNGRIGKKADEDDTKVIQTGKPLLEVDGAAGRRFEVEIPLQDAVGKTIGALSLAYPYKPGDNESVFLKRSEKIRDDLRKQIPSLEKLVELDP
jgi:hypothetical protein